MKMTLNKAAKALCIDKSVLKRDVKTGRLLMSDGCVDCESLRCLYPDHYDKIENGNLRYYDALKATSVKWKEGSRTKMADQNDKASLVNKIRSQEAEIHMLQQRILELEAKLLDK